MNKPEKILCKHNCIPCYFDGVDEGCYVCNRNETIDQYDQFVKENIPSEVEMQKMYCYLCIMLNKDKFCRECSQKVLLERFKIIHKLIKERLEVV